MLLETARQARVIIENGGRPPTPAGQPAEPVPADFFTLATAIATGADQRKLSAQATRFCLALSGAWAGRAVTDLSEHVRSRYPAAIEVDIEGWHHALEPGDDLDALGQQFSGWAHDAMTEAKAQAARRRLSIGGRLPARLDQIESRWELTSWAGQETVSPRAGPGPGPAMKLPDWDLRPTGRPTVT